MIGARLGHIFDRPLASIAGRIPLTPNQLSVSGLVLSLVAAYVLLHSLFAGGLLILAGGVFDILDGVVARTTNRATRFGAFLDSVLDRLADACLMIALAWRYAAAGVTGAALLSLWGLVGSYLISYARARAEGLGLECREGIMERPERILLIAAGALTGAMEAALWILSVLVLVTVVQRVLHVKRQLR